MDFSQIVAKQRQYFNSGATKPVSARIAALKKLAAALEAWETQFLDALRHDKSMREHLSFELLSLHYPKQI